MTQRRAFQCPNHTGSPFADANGLAPAVGELLREPGNPIRCDFILLSWRSTLIGKDKKGESVYEHLPDTVPGCGGFVRICIHGQRVCVSCPPQFTPTDDPVARTESLAELLARESEHAAERKLGRRDVDRQQDTPAAAPKSRVQLPFLGNAEPTHYKPSGRKGKRG